MASVNCSPNRADDLLQIVYVITYLNAYRFKYLISFLLALSRLLRNFAIGSVSGIFLIFLLRRKISHWFDRMWNLTSMCFTFFCDRLTTPDWIDKLTIFSESSAKSNGGSTDFLSVNYVTYAVFLQGIICSFLLSIPSTVHRMWWMLLTSKWHWTRGLVEQVWLLECGSAVSHGAETWATETTEFQNSATETGFSHFMIRNKKPIKYTLGLGSEYRNQLRRCSQLANWTSYPNNNNCLFLGLFWSNHSPSSRCTMLALSYSTHFWMSRRPHSNRFILRRR